MTSRYFTNAAIVTAYRDRHLCPFEDYRALIDHLCGEHVYLWDLPMARRIVAEHLEKRVPKLKTTERPPEKTDSGNAGKYVRACSKHMGFEGYTLAPMPKGEFIARAGAEAIW
jgi:hypothetical protein